MAEISELLSNENKLVFGEEKEINVVQNNAAEGSNLDSLESKQNCV